MTQFSRTPMQKTAFKSFAARLHFVPLPADGNLTAVRAAAKRDRRLAYLAVPPSAFTSLIEGIKSSGLATGTSIIIEKPFGHDLKSAEELNQTLHDVVPEERIFRIDHYMGKETVQNLLIFRFGNSLFERIWSRDAISRVEITVAESLGVEQRGKLYEEIGAIRDIVQNHMFQVLALVAMDPPLSFDAEAIRNEKVKVLQSITPIHPHDVVRGQYTAGKIDGVKVAAYRDEPGVSRSPPRRPMRRCVCIWNRGAGPGFPFCCAPASDCQRGILASSSPFRTSRCTCSRRSASTRCTATALWYAFSPTRASRSRSSPNSPARRSPRSRWT